MYHYSLSVLELWSDYHTNDYIYH